MNHFILHLRLTTKCNADCSYCSSYDPNSGKHMSYLDFKKSILWIKNKIIELKLGGERNNITLQYLGGEILTVPSDYLENCVNFARTELKPLFISFKDGVQTNLIGSEDKINTLIDLFGSQNIGTSIDHFTNQRTIKGSTKKYNTIFLKNWKDNAKKYVNPFPGVVVIDNQSYPYIEQEVIKANEKRYHLTLRPVFQGGSSNVKTVSNDDLIILYENLFNQWFLKQQMILQPFYQLLTQRIGEKYPEYAYLYDFNHGCPFQSDCAYKSMDLEPNGDIYICLDMADSHQLKLGNAIDNLFDKPLWDTIVSRSEKLSKDCYTCQYYQSCQGGCMSESLHHTNDVFGKTHYCSVWKSVFKNIDDMLEKNNIQEVINWLHFIDKKSTPFKNV